MRILITGITGFVGGHLAEYLLAHGGHTIAGVSRSGRWPSALSHLSRTVEPHACDLNDAVSLAAVLHHVNPDAVYHLAGQAATQGQAGADEIYLRENLHATQTLFDSLRSLGQRPRVLFTSTGLVYGNAADETHAFAEDSPLAADKPYPRSKILCEQAAAESGLQPIVVRLFNQIGPRQSADYAVAKYAKAIAVAERDTTHEIETKFLSSYRDFTDIRDMVVALAALMDRGSLGETYNAGSGISRTIRDAVDGLAALSSPKVTTRLVADAPADFSRGDISKLKIATGWAPTIPFERTLADVLNYWRAEVQSGRANA